MARLCSIGDCKNKHLAKGMCSSHYSYLVRNGSFENYIYRVQGRKGKVKRVENIYSWEYLIDNIEITDGCWLWTGSNHGRGYGGTSKSGTKTKKYAHRVMYEVFYGNIDDNLVIDHLCEVKRCVNPFHLEQVTLAENVRRAIMNKYGTHDTCRNGHPWDEYNTQYTSRGHRRCGRCNVNSVARARIKKMLLTKP